VLGKENVRQGFFGQEINLTTYNLARINMFLHDVNYEKFDIAHGDTLIDPAHWDDEPFEAIVSNPPYSIKWDGDANPLLINDPRYAPAGVLAPKSKADLAFTMHILSWLAVDGTAAIVEFPGVLYRGGAEQQDPQVPRRQQLCRRRHPAPAGPLLRHDDRDLHHRAQEVKADNACCSSTRRGSSPGSATRTSSPRRTSR
jgi:type I restriction system adenine methylase HsdM